MPGFRLSLGMTVLVATPDGGLFQQYWDLIGVRRILKSLDPRFAGTAVITSTKVSDLDLQKHADIEQGGHHEQ